MIVVCRRTEANPSGVASLMKHCVLLTVVTSLMLGSCAHHASFHEPVDLNPDERAALAIGEWLSRTQRDPENECFGMPIHVSDEQLRQKSPAYEPTAEEKLAQQTRIDAWAAEVKAEDPARWARYRRAYPDDVRETTLNRIKISPLGPVRFTQTGQKTFSFSYTFGGCCVFKGVHGTATAHDDGSVEISGHIEKDRKARSTCPQ